MDRLEALKYVWEKSAQIRKWYREEHKFRIGFVNAYNVRTYGLNAYGDLIDMILQDGINDKIIFEDEDGIYQKE